jgi:predicted MFS family arabinose efflux permease
MLTITAFMIVQGITPVLRMPFESFGRRPVLIGTLIIFSGASVGLVYTRRFVTLVVLRAVQGGGSAALTAIGKSTALGADISETNTFPGASVIGDISTATEKGILMGLFGAGE